MVKNQSTERKYSSNIMEDKSDILPDFPPGPLDFYRNQASFNWKEMALVVEDEELLRLKLLVWKKLENDPLFAHSPVQPSLEENRRLALERAFKTSELMPENLYPRQYAEITTALGQYDWSMCLRRGVLLGFFTNAIRGLGTSKHNKYIEYAQEHKLMGCVALTEISHGTNTKAFRTTCTYDPVKTKLIMNTPDFEAAKCWAANMGKTANYAYVLAQLYTPDGVCHGLHGFVVPIRDNQMNLLPGVMIGDMGEKLGLNGLDNGFMMFDNYELDPECLLDKNGGLTPEGEYVSPIKDPKKRFGASLGNLSSARVGIVNLAVANMCSALTIGIRYSAVRKQFGPPESGSEFPVIEYQMQQWRLFPYLAATYVMKYFGSYFYDVLIEFAMSQFSLDVTPDHRAAVGIEMHAISSAAKPIAGWLARDAVQECREACGGHGYLRSAGIGRIRDDGDAFLTFEGDNNVLLQQTSNWLINVWNSTDRANLVQNSPLGALTFLKNSKSRLKKKILIKNGKADVLNPKVIRQTYKWLVCYLLQSTNEKFQSIQTTGEDTFTARNDSQVYHARTLSIAFIEHYALEIFATKLLSQPSEVEMSSEVRNTLTNLMLLYGLWSLEKHLGTLYEGGYFVGPQPAKAIREAILDLCLRLKPDAVALVDAIAPPDFILNSVLGVSDGQVYKHLERGMKQVPGCFEKSSDWATISERLVSKL